MPDARLRHIGVERPGDFKEALAQVFAANMQLVCGNLNYDSGQEQLAIGIPAAEAIRDCVFHHFFREVRIVTVNPWVTFVVYEALLLFMGVLVSDKCLSHRYVDTAQLKAAIDDATAEDKPHHMYCDVYRKFWCDLLNVDDPAQ